MSATLKFGDATSNEGFTPYNTSSFSDLRPARIVRELIQNSLDAAVEAGEDTAIVRFQVDKISRREIPDAKGYENAFKKAVEYQAKINHGKLPDAAQQVVAQITSGLKDLDDGKAALLSIMDNGIGLDTRRMNSLLGDGASAKPSDSSGSYGNGHLAPMPLSDIRYMLYGGVTQDGERIVCGRTILANHPGQGELKAAEGYLVNSFRNGLDGNLYDFIGKPYPRVISKRLKSICSEWGHGCAVMIPVFNKFKSGSTSLWEIVSKVAAYNFCAAIYRGKLRIEVNDDGDTSILNKKTLSEVLEQDKERVRVARSDSFFEGLRPSGKNAYQILRTLADHARQHIKVSGGAVHLSLMTPFLNGNTRVDLFRNGMWITDNVFGLKKADFTTHQPFHAVIEVEAGEGGRLHRLIRKAEGPMHDTLSFSLLSETDQEELKKSLQQIAGRIKEQVPEVGGEEYTVDDFLLVNTDAGGGSGAHSFSFWGVPTMASRRRSSQLLPGLEPTDVDTPGRSKTRRTLKPPRPPSSRQKRSSPLPFRSVVVPNGKGKLSASIASQSDFAETWLALRVDENTDVTCDRIWQDEDVTIASFSIRAADGDKETLNSEIVSGGRVVKVHGLSGKTTYDLDIAYNTPLELASVVETPVFRLELHRPPDPPKAKAREKPQDADNT